MINSRDASQGVCMVVALSGLCFFGITSLPCGNPPTGRDPVRLHGYKKGGLITDIFPHVAFKVLCLSPVFATFNLINQSGCYGSDPILAYKIFHLVTKFCSDCFHLLFHLCTLAQYTIIVLLDKCCYLVICN